MTLTRGSRGEHASAHRAAGSTRHMGMREWGRRTLSFSGDWVARFRSRSPTPKPVARPDPKPSEHHEGTSSVSRPLSRTRAHLARPQKKSISPPAVPPLKHPPTAPSSAPFPAHPPPPTRSPAPQRGTSPPARARPPRCASPRREHTTPMPTHAARARRRPPRARR